MSRHTVVAVVLNARGQQYQVAFRGGQAAFLKYAFQAEIALKQDGRISNVPNMFGMNLYDFRIFSRSGRDFSGAVSRPSGVKRLLWVLII